MSVVISQVFGARDYEKMKRVFSTGFIFITCLDAVLAVVGVIITEPVLHLLKTPENIMPDSAKNKSQAVCLAFAVYQYIGDTFCSGRAKYVYCLVNLCASS